eukprot:TRINITY_DN10092_c0_g1_i1.p1 TRINITY_DN10092_c0_g1~~TRINITY_DN10092_c0_g1_i1.p1  ORF type:complete len:398 (-),score=55.65 TRINITY_DN10092_c0_g1_i1:61-1254(-)
MADPADAERQHTIVIDTGTGDVKAGFGGEDAPRSYFPTLMGWPRHPGVGGVMLGGKKDNFVGHEARLRRGLLSLRSPIDRGQVTDWEDAEKIWHHTLYCELQVAPEEHPLLLAVTPGTPKPALERLASIMFEVFDAPALFLANSAVLALYSTGRTTGCVLDTGEGQSHCVPVWEGYALPHHFRPFPIAGRDATSYLVSRLRGEGYPFSTPFDVDLVRDIKERLCYACANYEQETQLCQQSASYEREYTLPDGHQVTLSQLRFDVPEIFFKPSMLTDVASTDPASPMATVSSPQAGVHTVMHECIQKCDPEIRRELYNNVVVAGGNSLFPKFEDRLQRELQALASKGMQTKCIAFPERKFATWLGGSLLASLNTFPCMWISKPEYDDFGVSIIHRKCW